MRIWHLLIAVLTIAFALSLVRRVPAVGMLILLDSTCVICAIPLVRYERRIQGLWSRARRCGDQPWGRLIVLASATVVVVYQAITALILGMAVLSVSVTLLVVIASGVAALSMVL